MIAWLADNPGTMNCVLIVAALGLLVWWWQTRHRAALIALGAVAALAAVVFLVARIVDTDRKRIGRALQEMAQAIEERDLNKTFAHLAESCTTEFLQKGAQTRLSKKELRSMASRAIAHGGLTRIHLWDLDIEKLQPPGATIFFKAKPFGDLARGLEYCGCRAEMARQDDGRWLVTKFTLFKPESTELLEMP